MKLIVMALLFGALNFQANAQQIVDKNKGNHNENKLGLMDGNLVATVYYNMGEIADWQNEASLSGVWPKGTNHTYIDGVAVIVQAETQDPSGNIIHPLETNYYEFTRFNVGTGVTYGWWPLPGYANRSQSSPARSDDHNTWPQHWPDRNSSWDGNWNGYFGNGVLNADLETYFVMDDNEDRQYILNNHFYPDAADSTRGGLGMQVHARGFQWSQVLAEDVIFWLYDITNMGTTDYAKTLFAQYVDWGIGGHDNSANNAGDYNKDLNLSYAWSTVAQGSPGNWSPVGYAGYAFLESPGISDDHIDNDGDGLTDERRDNVARVFINNVNQDPFIVNVQQDTVRFHAFYGYPWGKHWDADENGNWRAFADLNNNGKWDPGEPLNDDVGTDGLGPLDSGYPGPDPDGTEGNGRPDQGEPNFGILDKDESDQIGLTGFIISNVHTYDLNNDERNWAAFSAAPQPHNQTLSPPNLGNDFSSYPFHLNGRNTYSVATGVSQETGETERFSMALIFGLNAADLFLRKKTVQQIYNANYHFAKPPDKPTIKAIAGDRKVTLYWDKRSELTFDAFYQRYNFEGYRIYRSTEPNFVEDKTITDANGQPTYRQPLAHFDLADGVVGLAPIGVNGAYFNLGDDSGLQHSFVDSTVQNGQTYYYAVTAYDQGFTTTTITGQFVGIPPSETTSIIKVDVNGEVKTDINTAVVTPHAPAAGYVAPNVKMNIATGPATGSLSVDILDPDSLRNNHTFRLEFNDSSAFHDNPNPWFQLIDKTAADTVLKLTQLLTPQQQTSIVRGMALNIRNDQAVAIDVPNTKWESGNSNYTVQVGFDKNYPGYQSSRINYPADFEVTFTAKGKGDTSFQHATFPDSPPQAQPSNIIIKNVTENINHVQFMFLDENKNQVFDDGDAIFIVCGDSAGKPAIDYPSAKKTWSMTLIKDTSIAASQQLPPQEGDVYRISTKKPFRTGEYFEFTATSPAFNVQQATYDIKKVAVVPNPYVGADSWEPRSASVGRGSRLVYFIHLPSKCTIRIYTMSAQLVQTLYHTSNIDNGQEPWNLISRDGMAIAYGVYVFHIDAPGIGSFIGKFAIMK